jgi:predicted transcriptional regulator
VLDNRNRFRIFSYVQDNPGCTPAEITTQQNMKNGTVKYHVQMLEAEGMIVLKRMGKFSRLFRSPSSGSDLERVAATYVRNETSRGLLQAILGAPGHHQQHPGRTVPARQEQRPLAHRPVPEGPDDPVRAGREVQALLRQRRCEKRAREVYDCGRDLLKLCYNSRSEHRLTYFAIYRHSG